MSGIVLSSSVRANLLTLQSTANLQAKVQERLATGKKVNSALDNATNFFTAASFTTRAGDLNRLLDGMGSGIQTIKAANAGIESIRKLVDNLQAIVRQALQAPSPFSSRASLESSAITNASSSDLRGFTYSSAGVTGAARSDSGGAITGASTLDDLTGGNALAAGDTLEINGQTISVVAAGATGNNQVNETDTVTTLLGKIDALTGTGTASSVAAGAITLQTGTASDLTIGGTAATKLGFSAGTTLRTSTVGGLDGDTLTVTIGSGPSAEQVNMTFGNSFKSLDDLNGKLDEIGLSASLSSDGKLTIQATNETASKTFTVAGTAATTLFGSATLNSSSPVRGGSGATQRDSYVTDFNNLLKQIDTVAADSSFNGVNLLNGDDLSVIFNETNTSKLDIKGVMFTATGLSINALTSEDFNDASSIKVVLDRLETTHATLRAHASKLGSNHTVVQMRQEFSKQIVATLNAGADNLTLADLNEEGANLLSLNTSQQLSQTALSLASQSQQAVLRLFG